MALGLTNEVKMPTAGSVSNNQIKHMVERFLGWRLPTNFNPDAGISFKPDFNEHTAHPMKHEPTGTNLFDFTQAEEMIRYLVDGMPGPVQAPESAENQPIEFKVPTIEMFHEGSPEC
jgi:hypothetical protein